MRTKLLAYIVGFLLGTAAGIWIGKFYWVVHLGRKFTIATRLLQESALAKEGKRTFDVYASASPEIAMFALSNHVRELDEAKSLFLRDPSPTNITASLSLIDVVRAEMLCYARLARLSQMKEDTNGHTRYLNSALKIASTYGRFGGDFGFVTNETSVREFALRCDREKRFW